jgi:hypothetical protein
VPFDDAAFAVVFNRGGDELLKVSGGCCHDVLNNFYGAIVDNHSYRDSF